MEKAGPCAYIRDPPILASARRFQGEEIRTLRAWLTIQSLYHLGVPAERLGRFYPDVRGRDPAAFISQAEAALEKLDEGASARNRMTEG